MIAASFFAIGAQVGRYAFQNALIVTFFWYPVSSILAFNALAAMHSPGRSRTGLRVLAWALVLAWAALGILVEAPGEYSRVTSPMHAVLLAAAGAYTLITRVETSRTDLLRDPSFVIAAFWVLYAVPTVFLSVAARYWMQNNDTAALLRFYAFRNTIVILSYPILVYGISLLVASQQNLRTPTAGRVSA